jgi:preprotein translocase subunit SecY
MEIQLKIAGIILIILASVHIIFPKYFHWEKELSALSLINRQMMKVHTFFIALSVFMMGLLCLYAYEDLLQTPLGNKISLGLFIFWTIRLFLQFFGYSNKLWKGKLFETVVHVLFSCLWIYLSTIFLLTYLASVEKVN